MPVPHPLHVLSLTRFCSPRMNNVEQGGRLRIKITEHFGHRTDERKGLHTERKLLLGRPLTVTLDKNEQGERGSKIA